MKFKKNKEEEPRISIAPLIDIVFLLLIFFMVTSHFDIASAVRINLPKITKKITGPEDENRVTLIIDESAQAYLEGEKKVEAYSRGMRQRLGIAEVLLKEPKIMFLDEPTLGLDPDGAQRMIDLIRSLNRDRKITVLLSSHHLYQVQKISHRVGIMIKGKMVAEGSIENLAKEKFGLGEEEYTLEEIYMKYFQGA